MAPAQENVKHVLGLLCGCLLSANVLAERYLALGDSYTIGESVEAGQRWPQQLARELAKDQTLQFESVDFIAQTGWNSARLLAALDSQAPDNDYQLVSLLIGVNDQYQGLALSGYRQRFRTLLRRAIALAGNEPSRVLVLSIPDYAYTPFGGSDRAISREIDRFNRVNATLSREQDVLYVDITDISRRGLAQPALVADDGLHPSAEQYRLWVQRVTPLLTAKLKNDEQNGP